MWSNLPSNNSEIEGTVRVMFAGMLTGHPEEEMSKFSGDMLKELSQMHERARQARQSSQGPMAIRLPSRKDGGAYTTIQGSASALSTVEDIGLSRRCTGSLGHGENTIYQA